MTRPPPVILLVEAPLARYDLVAATLGEAGYAVELAPTGARALERVAAGGVDLVLLDLLLPDISGLELCERLRTGPGGPALPLVVLTTVTGHGQRHAAFRAGANACLAWPIDAQRPLEQLHTCLELCARARARQGIPPPPALPISGGDDLPGASDTVRAS